MSALNSCSCGLKKLLDRFLMCGLRATCGLKKLLDRLLMCGLRATCGSKKLLDRLLMCGLRATWLQLSLYRYEYVGGVNSTVRYSALSRNSAKEFYNLNVKGYNWWIETTSFPISVASFSKIWVSWLPFICMRFMKSKEWETTVVLLPPYSVFILHIYVDWSSVRIPPNAQGRELRDKSPLGGNVPWKPFMPSTLFVGGSSLSNMSIIFYSIYVYAEDPLQR